MKTFSRILISLAAVLPLVVLSWEAKTQLGANWERNRTLLESRVRLHHTNQQNGEFAERSFEANVRSLDQYKVSLDAAKSL